MHSLNVDVAQLSSIIDIYYNGITVFLVKTVSIETDSKIIVNYILWGSEFPDVKAIIKFDKLLPEVIGYHMTLKNNEAKITFFKKAVK